ncbi:MAG: aldo/keto reductase [Candidatus Binatia bacterium]
MFTPRRAQEIEPFGSVIPMPIAVAENTRRESAENLNQLLADTITLRDLYKCRALGVGLLPWSSLSAALLAGVLLDTGDGRRASEFVRQRIAAPRAQLEAYEALCESLGVPPADVALAWLLHNPAVTAPIIGARTPQQLRGALRALELRLDDETLRRLDEIWPGPGGEAPKAYAGSSVTRRSEQGGLARLLRVWAVRLLGRMGQSFFPTGSRM